VDIVFNTYLLYYLKYHSIGLTGYLTWSNVFVSDIFGNYLPPRWDSSVYGELELPKIFITIIT